MASASLDELASRVSKLEQRVPSTKALRRKLLKPRTVSKDMLVFTQTEIIDESQTGGAYTLTASPAAVSGLAAKVPDSGRYLALLKAKLHVTTDATVTVSVLNEGTAFVTNVFKAPAGGATMDDTILMAKTFDAVANADITVEADDGAGGGTNTMSLGNLQITRLS